MDLNDFAIAVAKCRERWKGESGRYPDRIWDMAKALLTTPGVRAESISEVMKVKLNIVKRRLTSEAKNGRVAKPRPQFIELHNRGVENRILNTLGPVLKPEPSVTPHLVMHCKNGSELRVHLPSEPSAVFQSLMQRLVSCWVSAHH